MKQKPIPLPKEYPDLVKEFETLEQEIHMSRKQGCDGTHAWYLFQFARSKLAFFKATGNPDDMAKVKASLIETRAELIKAQQVLAKTKQEVIQKQIDEVLALAHQGIELLNVGKKYHATFLYQQMNERYMKLPQDAKQAVLNDCTAFKNQLMEQTKELGWN